MNEETAGSLLIMDKLRLPNDMYLASTGEQYKFIWLRDSFYIVHAYLHKSCDRYMKTYHAILDMFKRYEEKLDYHIEHKPTEKWQYIHARYHADTFTEVDVEWSHAQNDCIGEILFGIGEGIKAGKKIIRDDHDHRIVQKLVHYLNTLEYHVDENSGFWEESEEVRASSIAACVAGLISVSDIVYVPSHMIANGYQALYELFPKETPTRKTDLALLSIIYPYNLLPKPMAQKIIHDVETELLSENLLGCIRYKNDSYYSTLEKEFGRHQSEEFYSGSEPSWTMALPWLSLCHQTVGNFEKAKEYIEYSKKAMLADDSLPELYYAGDYKDEKGNRYNENSPLGWSNSLFVQAHELIYGR